MESKTKGKEMDTYINNALPIDRRRRKKHDHISRREGSKKSGQINIKEGDVSDIGIENKGEPFAIMREIKVEDQNNIKEEGEFSVIGDMDLHKGAKEFTSDLLLTLKTDIAQPCSDEEVDVRTVSDGQLQDCSVPQVSQQNENKISEMETKRNDTEMDTYINNVLPKDRRRKEKHDHISRHEGSKKSGRINIKEGDVSDIGIENKGEPFAIMREIKVEDQNNTKEEGEFSVIGDMDLHKGAKEFTSDLLLTLKTDIAQPCSDEEVDVRTVSDGQLQDCSVPQVSQQNENKISEMERKTKDKEVDTYINKVLPIDRRRRKAKHESVSRHKESKRSGQINIKEGEISDKGIQNEREPFTIDKEIKIEDNFKIGNQNNIKEEGEFSVIGDTDLHKGAKEFTSDLLLTLKTDIAQPCSDEEVDVRRTASDDQLQDCSVSQQNVKKDDVPENLKKQAAAAGSSRYLEARTNVAYALHGQLRCTVCGKKFTSMAGFSCHWRLKKKSHSCEIPDKRFTVLGELKNHNVIDEVKEQQKCNTSEKRFNLLDDLNVHELMHEGIEPHKDNVASAIHEQLRCEACDKRFSSIRGFLSHWQIHRKEKSYSCEILTKRFTELAELKKHNVIDEVKEQQKCNTSEKRFNLLDGLKSLNVHKLIHEGRKPHKCNICKRKFYHLVNLKVHKLIHIRKKPHKCNICEKRFNLKDHLNAHKLTHDGKKSHKSSICENGFNNVGNL